MSKKKASKPQEPSDSTEPKQELTDDELAKVAGGVAVISPRDAASGLPTGKRMHKPFTVT
jgi:bacteriocin-like protein